MNASLSTVNTRGERVRTPIWITTFQMDLQLEMQSAQLRKGMSHRPIRTQERYVEFGVTWNAGRSDRGLFHKRIREHQDWCLNHAIESMVLNYKVLGSFRGLIENTPDGAERFVPTYKDTYRFRVWNRAPRASTATGRSSPLLPTKSSVSNYGEGWYNLSGAQGGGPDWYSTPGGRSGRRMR